jgi:hypothetical protein
MASSHGAQSKYLFSAKGAMSIPAWGSAPGSGHKDPLALKARFTCTPSARSPKLYLIRAFSAGFEKTFAWGVAPGLH